MAKLREAERLQAQGSTIPQVCKRLQISEQTFYRWRIKYGALKEDEAQRLQALEAENARLKWIVAEQAWTARCSRTCRREIGEPGSAPGRHRVSGPQVQGVRAPCLPGRGAASLDEPVCRGALGLRAAAGQGHAGPGRAASPDGYRRVHALLVAEGWPDRPASGPPEAQRVTSTGSAN